MSTRLSFSPNVRTANSLRKVGVRSIARLPTDRIGEGTPVNSAETPVPTATPATADSTPEATPIHHGTNGTGLAAFTPYVVGALQDRGMALATVMGGGIVAGGVLMIGFVWLGPETRGVRLTQTHGSA